MADQLIASAAEAYRSGDRATTLRLLQQAIAEEPDNALAYNLIGQAHEEGFNHKEACDAYEKAVSLAPDNAEYQNNLGREQLYAGAFAEAEAAFRTAIDIDPQSAPGYYYLAQLNALRTDDPLFGGIEKIAAEHNNQEHRAMANFTLGKVFDAAGDYDAAFDRYRKGNEGVVADYRHSTLEKFSVAIKSVFTQELFASRRGAGHPTDRCVFIVGMPRSGSSLIEDALAARDDVVGLGERPEIAKIVGAIARHHPSGYPAGAAQMTDEHYKGFAEKYLEGVAPQAGDALRMIDKNLRNYLHYGFIRIAFPNATVIHTRRDPVGTCLSCYFHFFQDEPYAFDFDNLAARYAVYLDLTSHWESASPDGLYTLDYEKFVSDRDPVLSSLFEKIGLEDASSEDDAAQRRAISTSSAWQVRQPIYDSAIAHWRNYEKHLDPLFQALDRHGVPYNR